MNYIRFVKNGRDIRTNEYYRQIRTKKIHRNVVEQRGFVLGVVVSMSRRLHGGGGGYNLVVALSSRPQFVLFNRLLNESSDFALRRILFAANLEPRGVDVEDNLISFIYFYCNLCDDRRHDYGNIDRKAELINRQSMK